MRALVAVATILAAGLVGVGAWWMYGPHAIRGADRTAPDGALTVTVPKLSASARIGERLFTQHCAACHGVNAAGSGQGPPLVHRIYEPGHHGDPAFYRAATMGVRSHHWTYGNMPPVDGVSERDIAKIVEYVRDLQRANGIF